MSIKKPKLKLFSIVTFAFVLSFSSLSISATLLYISDEAMAQSKAIPISPPPPTATATTTTAPSSSSSSSSSSSTNASSLSSAPTSAPSSPSSPPSSPPPPPPSSATSGGFQTYKNPILGLEVQYPSNWLLRQHPYNATGNSTIATFMSPAQSAPSAASSSQAVQDRFVPYVDIFVFDSKAASLDQLINESVNNGNLLNATISQSKPITLNGGRAAHMVEYSIIIADRYLFDRMQVWTESSGKVFVISFTSEPQTYLTYLPVLQQMVQSLKIANPPAVVQSNSLQQQQEQQPSTTTSSNSQTINDTGSSTIPWLP